MRYVEVHRPLSPEEEQNVQTMPYVLPAGFTQFKDSNAVDNSTVERALYRRAGYPVTVTAGQASVVNNGAEVKSAQNGAPGEGAEVRITQ